MIGEKGIKMDGSFFQRYSKYNLILLFILIVGVSLYILFSFITSIIFAALVAYIFYPGFKNLNKHIKNKSVCAFILTFAIVFIVIVPLFLVFNQIIIEASSFYQNIGSADLSPISDFLSRVTNSDIDFTLYIKDVALSGVAFIVKSISGFFFTLPQKMIILFVTVFILYYFFKDGDKFVNTFRRIIPFQRKRTNVLLREFNKIISATIYGVFVSALAQGILGTIGLIIFGVPSPIVLGVVMTFLAMLPLVGPAFIWFPAVIFLLVNGDMFNGIALLVYGVFIISMVDNIIKPKIISSKTKIHPVIVVLGVFGGLKVFGLIGIIIGPLFLASLVFLYKSYGHK